MDNLKSKAQSVLVALETVPYHARRIMYSAAAALMCAYGSVVMTMATGMSNDPAQAIQNGVKNMSIQVYDIITSVFGSIAVVAMGATVATILWGGQKAAENAKSFAVKLVIAAAVVYLAPFIVLQVITWFRQGNVSDAFDALSGVV